MSCFKKLTFLKVMTTVAWADGEMTHSELNLLKSFVKKFDLDNNDVKALKPYFEAPVAKSHQDELFKQLIVELSSVEEKQEIIQAMSQMAEGKKTSAEEITLVEQFTTWLNESSFTARSFGLEKYFKRKVIKKIELKSAEQGREISLSNDDAYLICLLGTLLASVAQVDEVFEENEGKALQQVLKENFSFSQEELEVLFDVIVEQAKHGFDFHEVITETNQIITYNERENLIDCFFAIAAADGKISSSESEQIRKITKAMHIPHQDFKESKIRALEGMK
jgi:uncharacterized tellurite resistance protein B-like protein